MLTGFDPVTTRPRTLTPVTLDSLLTLTPVTPDADPAPSGAGYGVAGAVGSAQMHMVRSRAGYGSAGALGAGEMSGIPRTGIGVVGALGSAQRAVVYVRAGFGVAGIEAPLPYPLAPV